MKRKLALAAILLLPAGAPGDDAVRELWRGPVTPTVRACAPAAMPQTWYRNYRQCPPGPRQERCRESNRIKFGEAICNCAVQALRPLNRGRVEKASVPECAGMR